MEKLLSILEELGKRVEALQKQAAEFKAVIKQSDDIKKLAAAADGFTGQIAESSKASLALLKAAVAEARDTGTAKPVKADALARQFRSVIENIQKEAQEKPDGEIGVTLKSFEVEMKGLIVVENDTAAIITPSPDRAIDPGLLSTVRLSYGSIPVLKAAATTPPRAPADRSKGGR